MNKTTLAIWLAVTFLLAPRNLQAHSGIASQPSRDELGTEAAQAAPTEKASPWFARIGVVGAIYHSGATIATNGHLLPGATANVSNNVTVTYDIGYDITKNISVLLMLGFPPKPIITGLGTVESLGRLGEVRYGPAFLTGNYRIRKWGAFQPYAGPGTAYAIILKEHDGTVSQLSVHNNWGFALQAGAEYKLAKRWQLFADYKRVWLAVDAHGLLAGGVPVNARVKLDPSLVSAGIKFHFYWGVAP